MDKYWDYESLACAWEVLVMAKEDLFYELVDLRDPNSHLDTRIVLGFRAELQAACDADCARLFADAGWTEREFLDEIDRRCAAADEARRFALACAREHATLPPAAGEFIALRDHSR